MAAEGVRFDGRVISLKTEVEWAPNSPDLSPLDFFLWGYMKARSSQTSRATQELKAAIVPKAKILTDKVGKRVM